MGVALRAVTAQKVVCDRTLLLVPSFLSSLEICLKTLRFFRGENEKRVCVVDSTSKVKQQLYNLTCFSPKQHFKDFLTFKMFKIFSIEMSVDNKTCF